MKPVVIVDGLLQKDAASASGRDLARSVEAARIAGFIIRDIPARLPSGVTLDDVFASLPDGAGAPTVLLGFIPPARRYLELYEAAKRAGYALVTTPTAHLDLLEMRRSAERLGALTARTIAVSALTDVDDAVAVIGLPVFVKGSVQSLKHDGWSSCVASTREQLHDLVAALLNKPHHARGEVLIRELLPLRSARSSGTGFPLAREFRFALWRGEALEWGMYWDGADPFGALTKHEADAAVELARSAAKRFDAPLVGVDVAQLTDGRWKVIETNDPQFMGLSQLRPLVLWHRLFEAVSS